MFHIISITDLNFDDLTVALLAALAQPIISGRTSLNTCKISVEKTTTTTTTTKTKEGGGGGDISSGGF